MQHPTRGAGPRARFPGPLDYLHFFLGAAAGALTLLLPPIALILCAAYLAYQLLEPEPAQETYNDITEFLAGYAVGLTAGAALGRLWGKL